MTDKNQTYAFNFLSEIEGIIQLIRRDYSQQLEQAIQILFDAWQNGHWVYIMGNGGSASTATHLASDLAKTICQTQDDKGLKTMALSDNIPLVSALTNDWGWENLYISQLKNFYTEGGVGIAFSVHGGSGKDLSGQWSQNLLKGLQYIKDRGGRTIGFSGFDGGPMKDLVDTAIVVPADSTPFVEGLHVVLHHLVVFGLKTKITGQKKKAVFLDRDGVINETVDRGANFFSYGKKARWTAPYNYNEFRLKPNVVKALQDLSEAGYLRILTSNQPDLTYGLLSLEQHNKIMADIRQLPLDDIFICSHGRDEGCACKKPKPGMLLEAAKKWGIDLSSSFMIGDTANDIEAGKAAGCRTVLIDNDNNKGVAADVKVINLEEAVLVIKNL